MEYELIKGIHFRNLWKNNRTVKSLVRYLGEEGGGVGRVFIRAYPSVECREKTLYTGFRFFKLSRVYGD